MTWRRFLGLGLPGSLLLFCLLLWGISVPGVHYHLQGVVKLEPSGKFLKTFDGRQFQIATNSIAIDPFLDRPCLIDGFVPRADQLDLLTITAAATPTQILGSPPAIVYQAHQNPADGIERRGETWVASGVRWLLRGTDNPDVRYHERAVVTIDPNRVQCAYLVRNPFFPRPFVGHYLLLFLFRTGGVVNALGQNARGLVVSVEAYKKVGQSFSIIQGLLGNYEISWVLATWEDYAAMACTIDKEILHANRILLPPERLAVLVDEAMRLAAIRRAGESYHTVTNSCITNQIVLLNRVLKNPVPLWWIPGQLYNYQLAIPILVPGALADLGIVDRQEVIINSDNLSIMPTE